MQVYIEKPVTWIKSKRDGYRSRIMYENLHVALGDFNLETTEIPITYGKDFAKRCPPTDGFYLSYHSIGNTPYVWRIKETPVPFFYSIDRLGHSGWSEISERSTCYTRHIENVNAVNKEDASKFRKDMYQWLVSNNLSKYKQPDKSQALPASFVFYPTQTLSDPVRIHDKLNPIKILFEAAKYAKKNKTYLVVKRHPYCKDLRIAVTLIYLSITNRYFCLSSISITKLLEKCQSVIAGNSGVGMEALFYEKPVYSFSYSEYDIATEKLGNYADIDNAFKIRKSNNIDINKFLYYYFSQFCFDARNIMSIKNQLASIIRITQNRAWETPEFSKDYETPSYITSVFSENFSP